MTYLLRQLASFALLPGIVVGFVPWLIGRANHTEFALTAAPIAILEIGAGVVVGAIGVWLLAYSVAHFASRGRGTLAPWDPPRGLVVSGPYRYVRNPMISGVCFMLAAEALLLRSAPHAWWALTVATMNLVYIPLIEEPGLRARFGQAYDEYAANVGRLLPRLRPWRAPSAREK